MSSDDVRPVMKDLNVIVSGQGGDGSLTVVNLLAAVLRESGMNVYTDRDVLSRIKGGITAATLRASAVERFAIGSHIDLLVALDPDAVETKAYRLNENSIVIYDSSGGTLRKGLLPAEARVYGVPFAREAVRRFRRDIYKNSIAFAVAGRALGLPDDAMHDSFHKRFARLGPQILQYNLDALDMGLALADDAGLTATHGLYEIRGAEKKPHMLITGNEAFALGFLVAGGRFFCGYPITPSTDVMEWLEKWMPQFGGVVRQAEDELSAINMAIGAAMTGARTMVATCGPGLSLMQEGIGQLGMAEVPLVIVDAQRGGPSTGMPTKPEQSDLNLLVFGGHGDFPRIVLSPGTPEECFHIAAQATNLAQMYQCPVFIASDQGLSQNLATIDPLDLSAVKIDEGKRVTEAQLAEQSVYKRYAFTEDGVSPYSVPGMEGGLSLVTFIPLVLVLMTMTGAVYPAIDLTAGERERGTLESLMVCPVPVIDLIVGKFLVVVIVSLLGATLNLASMGLTIQFGGLKQALAMGFDATELIKRFTAAGTGPGQGGIPGHNLPLFVAQYHGDANVTAMPTTVRVPLVPTFIATYAGSNHDMCKRTPVHDSQKAAGGVIRRIGVWKRARYFSTDFSCQKEIKNVRTNVGMLDASTLGKFRIWGPDALNALQRVYVSDMSNIANGKAKYSAMCNEDACIIDDGVVVKRAENDYYFTTSTARAGATVEWIRYHTRYDDWNFHMVNLTDAFGVINIAGPNARKVLKKVTDADISDTAFPYAGYREFMINDAIPVRSMRLGFVGELSFELHVPASYMQTLWDVISKAGKKFGIRHFGLEAQNVLRMEKAHLIIGSESEQRTTLHDVGLGFLWDRNKSEAKTVGAVALRQTENQEGRFKLVGFKMEDPARPPKDGSIIVDSRIRGYVCIARHSFTLKEPVGLALVEAQLAEEGTRLQIYEDECKGQHIYATVVPTPFYDPEGKQLRI